MKISFDEIPDEGLIVDVTDQSWFPGHEFPPKGTVTAHIQLKKTKNRVLMKGEIHCPIELVCDRCLENYSTDVTSSFSIFFDWVDRQTKLATESEHSCTENEMDVIELCDPIIDLFTTLEQQFYLTLPAKSICDITCKGLCSHCGKNITHGQCSCSGKDEENPFSILAKLKDS